MASAEIVVRTEVDMTVELKKAFVDLGAGLAAATAAIAKATPPTAYDMLPDGLKSAVTVPTGSTLADVKREALRTFLDVLDGWIDGQKGNHEASGHRYENRGEECWRRWDPADIRAMVNDAARELGLREFPLPEHPKENEK